MMVKCIDELLQQPFYRRTREDQIKTISEGKPRPELPDVIVNGTEKFDVSLYDKELWITACNKEKAFYCWSCLLFAPVNASEWNKEGYRNFKLLNEDMVKHSHTVNHIDGLLKLKLFVRQNVTPVMPSNLPQSSQTNKNYICKRLLKVICELLSEIYPPSSVNETDRYILTKCTEAMKLVKRYEKATFSKVFDCFAKPKILKNYIATLSSMMKTVIKEEMSNSTHASLIINEHSCEISGVLISIVFRYLKKKKVCERFLEFYFISSYKEIDVLISNIILDYGIEEKLVAFSFDSSMTSVSQLQQFVCVLSQARGALFVPCYWHSFEAIIERSVSQIDNQCNLFFKSLNAMKNYFNRSSKMQTSFNNFMKEHLDIHNCQSSFKLIMILKKFKTLFSEFFKNIKQNMEDWCEDDVIQAIGFRIVLDDPSTTFYVETFFLLSNLVVEIDDILRSSTPERVFKKYQKYKKSLNNMRTEDFQSIWDITCKELKESQPNTFRSSDDEEKFRMQFQFIFDKIINCVFQEIELRLESLEIYYDYLSICSPEYENLLPASRGNFAYFPTDQVMDAVELQSELNDLRKRYPVLNGKGDLDVHEFLVTKKLQSTSTYLFRALQAILTTPCKPAFRDVSLLCQGENGTYEIETLSPKKELLKSDTINHWSKVYRAKETVTNNWSFLAIERDLLHFFSQNEQFCCDFHNLFESYKKVFAGV